MSQKITSFITKYRMLIMIFVAFAATTFMQAVPAFVSLSHESKSGVYVIILFIYATICYFLLRYKKLSTDDKIFLLVTGGVIIRSFYAVFTGVTDRQHDEGYFSGLSDDLINPGHLGYVEYLCKFGHLPDFSPYKLFSYYHPPLHHIIACLYIDLQLLFGVYERYAFENIQALTVLYSCLCLPVSYGIFKKVKCSDTCMVLAMAFITFHPGMIFMSASVNNDMLCTLLTFTCFYFGLTWMENKTLPNLLKIALSLGFGMITKLNCAVMAFPLAAIFLMHFISECKEKRMWKAIREFAIFGVVTAGIGLSYVIRNLLFYDTNPGVPVLTEESVQYIGDLGIWDIYGLTPPLEFGYPFHTINGDQICNIWQILFRTSLFDEVRPDLSDVLLMGCRISLILAMLLGAIFFVVIIVMQIREIRAGHKELGVYLLTGYLLVVVTFILFVVKYPYTCSANFRYVVISILYTGIGLLQLSDKPRIKTKAHLIFAALVQYGFVAFILLITSILLVWNQW